MYHYNYVKRFSATVLAIFLIAVVALISANTVSAHHQKAVLGDSDNSDLSLAQTAEGPGFILPDSPFFFLDRVKQNVRLMLAFSAEQKAKVRSEIAGERLAELNLMLSKNHENGIRTALEGVSENLDKAADEVNGAKLKGQNVSELAQRMNEIIKEKHKSLSTLEERANGEIKLRVQTARHALKRAKTNVEDHLPEDVLKREMEESLHQEIEENIRNSKDAADKADRAAEVFRKLISESKDSDQNRRREMLMKMAEERDFVSGVDKEEFLRREEVKHDRLIDAKERFSTEARSTAEKIRESADTFRKTKDNLDKARRGEDVNETFQNEPVVTSVDSPDGSVSTQETTAQPAN
jgi:hypothetical protein